MTVYTTNANYCGSDIDVDYPNCSSDGGAIIINNLVSNQNIIIDNCYFKNNTTFQCDQGYDTEHIAVYRLGPLNTLEITNNYFELSSNQDDALYINKSGDECNNDQNNIVIDNNTFKGSGSSFYGTGITLYDFGKSNVSVEQNIFDHLYTKCFYISYHGGEPTNINYLKFNNNTMTDIMQTAVEISNGAYYTLNNNVFNRCSYGVHWYDSSSQYTTESLKLNNNLFYSESSNACYYDVSNDPEHPLVLKDNIEDIPPLLDNDYRPIWTLDQQSPCIEAGVRDLDGDYDWWFEDEDDQDIFGTRPEIGAVAADMDGWGHVLPKDKVRWICFPYTLNDPNRYELSNYLQGIPVSRTLSNYNNIYTFTQTVDVFGQKGFKIKATNDFKIDHFGKPVGNQLHYPSGNQIILTKLPFAESGANLIGYYKEESCDPMDAFQNLLDSGMIESVKAEDWTIYYGYPQNPKGGLSQQGWNLISLTGERPTLDLGEAVEVYYKGSAPYIEFNWSDGIPSIPKVKSSRPSTFVYDEKENYLPIQVKIDEFSSDKSNENFGELGIYINGQCKGAGIISDSLVTVFAYLDSLVITEDDSISFIVHDYQDSKKVKEIEKYRVYDSNLKNYVTKISHKITDTVVFFDLTSKDDHQNNILPVITEIKSIYPNPFNPETTIEFNIKENSNVKIKVYNLKGQLVKTVINNELKAGKHKVVWNGTNSNNQRVASGIYFCRMEAKNKTVTKKMILMK